MLSEIYIENFAIIDKLNIKFSSNFNVLTGETGSGKSIIIEAIELLTGQRFRRDFIGKHDNKAIIEGIFIVKEKEKKEKLESYGIYTEDDLLIISRENFKNGKSVNRINGRITNLSIISKITELLIDIHGQNDNQSLLKKENYINLIDAYDKSGYINKYLVELKKILDSIKEYKKEYEKFNLDDIEKDREIDLIKFQLSEINDIDLENLNEEETNEEFSKLNNISDIKRDTEEILGLFEGNGLEELGVKNLLGKILNISQNIKEYDKIWNDYNENLISIYYEIEEAYNDISSYSNNLYSDEEKLFNINILMEKLTNLKRKYGNSVDKILEYKERINNRLIQLEEIDNSKNKISKKIIDLESKSEVISKKITDIRIDISKKIENEILKNLKDLNMKNSDFKINISKQNKINYNGWDKIEFLIRTNIGQDLMPLTDIASGGELSRIMLGFKSVLAEMDDIDTIIFDEIDAGISGRTAQIVGEKILDISSKRQIIVISHLPQISVLADNHLLIMKEEADNSTISKIIPIEKDDRIEEISRLIGGVNITDITRLQAKEMLSQAENLKSLKLKG